MTTSRVGLTTRLRGLAGTAGRLAGRNPQAGPPPGSRRVLVTGGASGLGLALTRRFLARGDTVLVTDLAPTDQRPETVPEGAQYMRLDVRSETEWMEVRDEVEKRLGGLDMLCNNAGIAQGGRIDRLTEEDWQLIVDINLLGVARGCRAFVPLFRRQGSGHLVNTASLAGIAHPPAMSSYTAVKAGVVALSESLRWELEPFGITVSVLCPSFFRTNLAGSLNTSDPTAVKAATSLITKAKLDADQMAESVVQGLDSGRFLVLPDRDAKATELGKRLWPIAYAKAMRAMGRKAMRG